MSFEIREVKFGSAQYHELVSLRDLVLRKPLGLKFTQEQLDAEHSDTHFGAYLNNQLIGCVILTPATDEVAKIRQMAVVDSQRGSGIGKKLIEHAEGYAKQKRYKEIQLNARIEVTGFYEKLGYLPQGPKFEEVTIPHQKMAKKISA